MKKWFTSSSSFFILHSKFFIHSPRVGTSSSPSPLKWNSIQTTRGHPGSIGEEMKKPVLAILVSFVVSFIVGCAHQPVAPSWKYSDFKEVTFDPFPGMNFQGKDGGLTSQELSGRIVWNLWTGDNAGFWDWLSTHGFGTADLLKMVTYERAKRFERYGIINQPGYARPSQPDQYGLFIDVPKDPKYEFDSRIDVYTYGRSTGVMGLRLFPNPNFNEAAKAKWDSKRYYDDPKYYNDKSLV